MNDYSAMVARLSKPGEQIKSELTAKQAHMLHMAVGISGEAGEILDAIKKHAIYQKSLDVSNVVEELGDLEFFMEGLRAAIGVSREEVLGVNMKKLAKRYHRGTYSNQQAQQRADKHDEPVRTAPFATTEIIDDASC
jgi:NTP pyrophosphatase (non-canonical NTP hydrolase)